MYVLDTDHLNLSDFGQAPHLHDVGSHSAQKMDLDILKEATKGHPSLRQMRDE